MLVSLLQASIPYSFYNVREGVNDKIDIIVSDAAFSSPSEHVISLDAGNYTAISLSSTFKKLVEDVLNTASLASTVSIKYDRDKQKFQFSILPTTNDNQGRMVIINLSHGQKRININIL